MNYIFDSIKNLPKKANRILFFRNNKNKNNKINYFQKIIIIPILVFVIISSYILLRSSITTDTRNYHKQLLFSMFNDTDFNDFIYDLFKYEVTSNSVTTAYTLRNPAKYSIPILNPCLTDFSSDTYAKDIKSGISKKNYSKLSKKLSSFQKEKMNTDNKIIYDLLSRHLTLSEKICDYPYFETLLGKTTGAAACIPVTLSEYPLNSAEDIDTYLAIVRQLPEYFNDVIDYENERTKRGMPTPTFILKDTQKELSNFIKNLNSENNCFITTFNDRINKIQSISAKDKKKYISNNKYYVNQYVLSSYILIYDYISLRIKNDDHINNNISLPQSQSKNISDLPDIDTAYGLSAYKMGKEYYELLVKDCTGSYRNIPDFIEMTEKSLNKALSDVLYIATTDTDAYIYYCDHPMETGFHSTEGILEALSLFIREDYPILESTPVYNVKTVPDALTEMVSPAYYMIPAIDDYDVNTIYINPTYTYEENGNLFTTLAHEGFPGHLYQTVYFNNTNPAPIRQILDYPGYVEGWATYVELNSFSFIDYPKYPDSLATLYRSDTIINLAISSRIDMGVNYENWTLADTCKYFEDLGFNSYYASDIYTYVVEAPGNYLSYFIGYLEIENLKQEYKNLKMENYNEKEFHKALLDIGPGDFETIKKYLLR